MGLDVLNVAVHLTATMLSGSQPNTPFDGECLLTMPYGEFQWGVCLGSLDLMREQASLEMMEAAALTAGGRGEEEVRGLLGRVGHGQFELVIMNPPFTRHGAREGDRLEVHNPAFAAFEATDEQQDRLAAHLKRLAAGGCAHGHAGLASYFADLAHRKVAPGGTVALVLPLSSMSGRSWEAVRALWRSEYCSIVITTIAERGTHTRSFSADTGMAECLFVARKRRSGDEHRAVFAILDSQPQTTLEGELIAQAIADSVAEGSVRTLEAGPFGGTRIRVGETHVGELLECPLPAEGAWQMVGVSDMSLGQTAYQLANGRLWIEGMPAAAVPDVPIARIGDVCQRVGPHHLDLTGAKVKADGLPQGPFERIEGYDKGVAYPSLWNHSAHRERSLVVAPDSHCRLRHVPAGLLARLRERAEARWATAARAHYSVDLQFNSQSLVVAMTDAIAIGGVAWPTIVFEDPSHEFAFALWSNSTLGLLCHWWMSNRTQAGRGRTTVTGIPLIPTLDVLELTAAQHDAAKTAFGWLRQRRLLPFDQIDEDTARQDLDRRLIVEVLGLEPALCDKDGPVDLLRRKLASEPSIHGDKQSRIVFTPEGEASIQRAE